MVDKHNSRLIEVAEDGQLVALAVLEPSEDEGVVRAAVHSEAGHLPAGARVRLIDAVLDSPETRESDRLEATLPLGDTESLDRLRERCEDVSVRPAGATCLVDAAVSFDARAEQEPAG